MDKIRNQSHDPIWHLQLGVAAIIGLQLLTANSLFPYNKMLIIFSELLLIAFLSIVVPHGNKHVSRIKRTLTLTLIGVVTAANILALIQLLDVLIVGTNSLSGRGLLLNAGIIYITNIFMFALWYWVMDGGGPDRRTNNISKQDFIFPQMVHSKFTHTHWLPGFTDYLYLSVTNVTNFAAADTLPVSHRAKIMMMIQSLVSLATVVLVITRAISIMQ